MELKGWKVTTCFDGAIALTRLADETPYDVLVIDNQLPNLDGVEIVRYVRQLAHRQGMPIIMLTAAGCEVEAFDAGVDVFLRKPDDMTRVVGAIASLAGAAKGGTPPPA